MHLLQLRASYLKTSRVFKVVVIFVVDRRENLTSILFTFYQIHLQFSFCPLEDHKYAKIDLEKVGFFRYWGSGRVGFCAVQEIKTNSQIPC